MEDKNLFDIENNFKVYIDHKNSIFIDDTKNYLNFRIKKHREFLNIIKKKYFR
ncbi:hypothetical protein FLAN108750_10560 [Flavobacterium antarcticum]|uniref:hypothetical protein n=1 Tax=Flavobacterium antarcticum TaxID=271155 RepID=UPI0003B3DAD4|nr:hypothetical protein [Flavobacterium antarcticum]